MPHRVLFCLALLALIALSGCQGPPPTQYVLIVTATFTPQDGSQPAPETTAAVNAPTATPARPAAGTPTPTSTPDPRPTATTGQIQVAEQVFEKGRMFWIQPRNQIWVMVEEAPGLGTWLIYDDTFAEGEPETDPTIRPPAGKYQPERGFGKLWRSNRDVRDALGWGLTTEFGYVSNYEYHPGGTVDALTPGYHILFSLYQERFQFNEADGTWQRG